MQARRGKPQAQKCGQSYLCDRKNKPWVTSPNTEKANGKLTARNIANPPRLRDPTSHSALVTAASSAVRLPRTGQGLSRCGRSQEYRYILPAPAMERPRTSESALVRGSNGGVRCARKSDPMNDRATTLIASQRQMAMPTDEEARRREPLTGATAIPCVEYGGESHCASPTTSGAFTHPKQCNRPCSMNELICETQ